MEDEDVSDNWEDAADSGEIERRLEAKLKINQKSNSQSLPVKTAVVASRPAQQVKSLAQREAEYAEARRRILGSAEEPSQERPDTERSAPAGAPSVSECLRPNNHIIRQPLGPDGTTGFRLSR
ncbi:hypothetical protein SRHO_G00267410 [Serrasalmus rhombeus]